MKIMSGVYSFCCIELCESALLLGEWLLKTVSH